jgi:autotransporter-associated beta strand protein
VQGTDFGTIVAGTGTLQQLGPGTLTLNTANAYSGQTIIGNNASDNQLVTEIVIHDPG